MYKIKTTTEKRFFLGWVEITQLERKYHPAHGYCSTGGTCEVKKWGFGGINYALKFLNGEIKIEAPEGKPTVAGVEGGPASELNYWFEEAKT